MSDTDRSDRSGYRISALRRSRSSRTERKDQRREIGGFEEMPGVFAGGDCATGPSTVISAIAAGKVIAANIDEYLGYHHEITADVEIPEPKLEDKPACGRVNLTEREAGERVKDLKESKTV